MGRSLGSIWLALIVGSAAWAQDGGKLDWKGRKETPQEALAEAKRLGRSTMLFFTSEG